MTVDERIQAYMDENFTGRRLLKETERGSVWLASDKAGCPVIIKHIRRTGLPYQKLKELAHPLWPGIRFVSESETDTWIVEEYISGKNLRDFKEDGNYLTENEARSILLQMADGLSVLHRAGILHRDIKPSNLIWQGRQIWLVDFDAAREMRDGDEPDTHILGTAGYAPPEQYGFGQTDERSDLYALGKTLDELLNPAVQDGIRDILHRMTAFAPKDRYASAAALRNALYFERIKIWLVCAGVFVAACVGWIYFKSSNPPVEPPAQIEEQQNISSRTIQSTLLVNGKPYDGKTIVVPYEEWSTWQEIGRENYYRRTLVLPDDWTLGLRIENNGSEIIQTPRMELQRSGTTPMTAKANATSLAQGEQTAIVLSLAGQTIKSKTMEAIDVHLRMDNPVGVDDAHNYYWNLHIYLDPPPDEAIH